MTFEIRVPGADDYRAFSAPVWDAFGVHRPTEHEIEDEERVWEPERSLGAVDGGRWVGSTGIFSFGLTVPGGGEVPAAGVTMVGVSPTYRRRGVLRALMARQLDDVAAAGEPVAVLTASETSIYGRFGYGWATFASHVSIDTDRAGLAVPPDVPGTLRLVEPDDAVPDVAVAYDRYRPSRAGSLTRNEAWWHRLLADRPAEREGAGPLAVVVHDGPDGPDGYATYAVVRKWERRLPVQVARVADLYGATPAVEAALWQYLLELDLVARVTVRARPVDDPIRWRLREPRRLVTSNADDFLWCRVVDVPAALAARRYPVAATLRLEVVDPFRPQSGGTFLLDAGADGVSCTPTPGVAPELTLGAAELGSVYLGGVAPSALAAADRIMEHAPGALARADALFLTPTAPFCATEF